MLNHNNLTENKEVETKEIDSTQSTLGQGSPPSDVDTSESEDIDERYQYIAQRSSNYYQKLSETSKFFSFFIVGLGTAILAYTLLRSNLRSYRSGISSKQITLITNTRNSYKSREIMCLKWSDIVYCRTSHTSRTI
jgi:hypothetical protein